MIAFRFTLSQQGFDELAGVTNSFNDKVLDADYCIIYIGQPLHCSSFHSAIPTVFVTSQIFVSTNYLHCFRDIRHVVTSLLGHPGTPIKLHFALLQVQGQKKCCAQKTRAAQISVSESGI